MKKVYISTLGCAKNLVDSEMILGSLLHRGYAATEEVEEADIAIVNTCGFIEAAKEESINEILQIAANKSTGKLERLVVCGCLAQRYSQELKKEIPEIDLILGTTSFINIAEELEKKESNKVLLSSIDDNIPSMQRHLLTSKSTAYLKIAEGCDNLCTYCIIPKLRGKYRSRPFDEIIEEAYSLASAGVKELILIAQDTTKYGIDISGRKMLSELLAELDRIEGFKWIRILYSYPEDLDERVIQTIKSSMRIVPYFDIPIQHASDSILKKMNRKTTQKQIEEKIRLIRSEIRDPVIRTTLIVGFPGETREDFEELCSFIEAMRLERVGVFEYSLEEGTPAAKMPCQIEPEIKSERRDRLMKIQQGISLSKNKEQIGKVFDVLIENHEEENLYSGRTCRDMMEIDGAVFVRASSDLEIGSFVKVIITDAMEYDLIGEVYEYTE